MRTYFVGGFLGSGKTTSIAGACRILMDSGKRVAVVTNDQGKLQVDGLFMRASGLSSVEVGGGCFCCRYDDFDAKLAGLVERESPDAVFAESVGSCADIVATVVRPFEAFRARYGTRSVFTVMADSRLLLARLSGRRLPFSEDVVYIFDRQLEEAELIGLNKRDLLKPGELEALEELADRAWPGKRRLAMSGSTAEGAASWLAALESASPEAGRPALEIDYQRYGSGERELAWLDERLLFEDSGGLSSDGSRCRDAILAFVERLALGFLDAGLAIGHLKLQVSSPGGFERKIGLGSGDFLEDGKDPPAGANEKTGAAKAGAGAAALAAFLGAQLPPFTCRRAEVSLNARVQCPPEELAALAAAAAAVARGMSGITVREEDRSVFRPGFPEPTHRMA